jgi:predicted O-methyltransferase YrrM
MKDRPDAILRAEQARYLDRLLPRRDALTAEMEAEAARDDVPISDPEVGRLLEILAAATKARRILEIGTAIGYGTLCLARGAPEARIVSIDPDPRRLATARGYLERAGVLPRVELVERPALEALADLAGPFDLVYLDALKTEYRRYLDLALPKVTVDGVVVADNLLWKGWIAEPPGDAGEDGEDEDADTKALRAFNVYLMAHPQLRALVLPLGDGVGLAVKTRPLQSELGGPW